MREIFIVNPKAGKGQAVNAINELDASQKRKILIPKNSQDATLLTMKESQSEEPTVIYSVGGDGTLNAVLNGIVGSKALLGVIPLGSGNDFYRTLQEEKEYITSTDIGRLNYDYFINVASVGIDANVARNVIKNRERFKISSYALAIIEELLKRNKEISITTDSVNQQVTMLTVCNGRYYGNGIKIAPSASIHDGKFDIYQVASLKKMELVKLVLQLLKSEHEKSPFVAKQILEELKFTAYEPDALYVNLDGEVKSFHGFDFEVVKDGVKVITDCPSDVKRLVYQINRKKM